MPIIYNEPSSRKLQHTAPAKYEGATPGRLVTTTGQATTGQATTDHNGKLKLSDINPLQTDENYCRQTDEKPTTQPTHPQSAEQSGQVKDHTIEVIKSKASAEEEIHCILCSEGIQSNKQLADHYRRKHPDSALYYCPFCEQVYETKNSRDYHWWQLGESCSMKYRQGLVNKIDQLTGDWSEENSAMLIREYSINQVLLPAKESCLRDHSGLSGEKDMEKLLGISAKVLLSLSQLDQSYSDKRMQFSCLICQKRISVSKAPKHYENHDILYLNCPFCTEKFLNIMDFRKHLAAGAAKCQKYIKFSMALIKRHALGLHDDSAPPELSDGRSLREWLTGRENAEECPMCCEEQTPNNVHRMIAHLAVHKRQLAGCRAGSLYMCSVCHRFFKHAELAVVHWKLAHPGPTSTSPATAEDTTTHKSGDCDLQTDHTRTAPNELNQQQPKATSISESFRDNALMSEYKAELLKSQDLVLAKWERILCHVTALKTIKWKARAKRIRIQKLKYSSKWKCEICADTFISTVILAEHLATEHGVNQTLCVCPQCNKAFRSKKSCDAHIQRTHEQIMVVCTVCGVSIRKHRIMRHMRSRHDNNKSRYNCTQCAGTYATSDGLAIHRIKKHDDPEKRKVLSCSHCPFQTKEGHRLHAHIDTHNNDKPYACKVCGDTFKHKYSQYRHMQTKHKDSGPIECSTCSASFVQRASLNRHMKIHEKLRYICDVCGKIYSQTHPIMKHRQKHHPEAAKVKPSELLSKQDGVLL